MTSQDRVELGSSSGGQANLGGSRVSGPGHRAPDCKPLKTAVPSRSPVLVQVAVCAEEWRCGKCRCRRRRRGLRGDPENQDRRDEHEAGDGGTYHGAKVGPVDAWRL
jgi:hypothetical protein